MEIVINSLRSGANVYARAVTGLPVADATGGYKCFNRRVLEAIGIEQMHADGYGFQVELTYRALKAGFHVREVPIVFIERESGESKMSKRIVREAVWRVWWLRIQDLAGRL